MHCHPHGIRCCSCWCEIALHLCTVKNLLTFRKKDHMKEDWMRTDRLLPLLWCLRTSPDSLSLSTAALIEV